MMRWISVKQRLPELRVMSPSGSEISDPVLAYDGEEHAVCAYIRVWRNGSILQEGWEIQAGCGDCDAAFTPTHWMPLTHPQSDE